MSQKIIKLILIFLSILLGIWLTYINVAKKKTSPSSKVRELVILSPNSQSILTGTIPAFEEKYHIKVRLVQGSTGQLMQSLERKHSPTQADLFFGGNYSQFESHRHLFDAYQSVNIKHLIADYVHPSEVATPYTINGSVLILNNELAKDLSIQGYDDLLQPELRGKIAFGDPNSSSSAFAQLTNMLLAKGDYKNPKAWDYVRALLQNINAIKSSSSADDYQSVADGKMIVGLTYEDPCVNLQKSGANISIVYPKEGTVFLPSSMALIKGSKSPKDAKKFIDFLLSLEVQNTFAQSTTNRPIRQDAQTSSDIKALDSIKTLTEDYDYVSKHKNAILAKYNQLRKELDEQKE
ncbi:extracellular solute-binding protein [Streptococcus ictaluri]|uniref:ABC transporter, solute-binding protein n=1 Tax=Streptococcus ictaluri 707-05 TaxID=764299 RepID=G5K2L4_9STRE|nr:extracellular solute-binding protein [Streptococcus ictaluri]EHI69576.1 ABC transporter, solute-binding protein [Streptococcus ictaluri 707-05]